MPKPLSSLVPLLEKSGYLQNYLTFGEGNQRLWDWQKTARVLRGPQRLLWDTFLPGKTADRKALERLISSEVVNQCRQYGLCRTNSTEVEFGATSLLVCSRTWLFTCRHLPTRSYFGEDTRALMPMVPAVRNGRVLGLFSENGAEVLGVAGHAGLECAVQTTPRCAGFVRANLELNEATSHVQVEDNGTVPEGEFAVIAARIPSFLEVGGLTLPDSVAGGPDGLERWRAAARVAGRQLTRDGLFAFVGLTYGGEDSAAMGATVKALFAEHGLSCGLTLCSKVSLELGRPVFNQILSQTEVQHKLPRQELLEKAVAHLKDNRLTHSYMAKGIAWRTRRGKPGFVLDLSPHYYGTWST